ncbi:hypothetical protein BKA63DRAFT_406611 [Paraphoma chrysanthemicola]|nr:hypothetical protein BKA63DRAFT_406611 [Paraphoma chrysanthemicola]
MFDDVELDKPISDEHEINEQGKIIKKRVPICLEVNASPRDWEVEYDRVLRNISGGTFLPGLEHLTNIESRSAFISYDQDIQALHQATAEFLADRNDGECNCLDGKVGAFVLPGDNFLLAENNTGLGLTLDHPTAESLFDLIDNAVEEAFLVDEFDAEARCLPVEFTRFGRDPVYEWYTSTTQSEKSPRLGAFFDPAEQRYTNFTALDHLVQCPSPRPGAFFDGVEQRYTNFTALDQLLQCPTRLSGNVRAQDSATDDISAVSYTDDEVDELPMMQIPKLHYYDAGSQQYVGYTAFNQLLADAEDELSTPRIHRMDDTFDETDFDLVDGLREINELANDDKSDNCEGDVNLPSPFTDFDFGLDVPQRQVEPNPNASRRILSIKDLRSSTYVWRTKLMKRPRLMVVTQLDTIAEVLSDDDVPSGDSSPSSDASIDFAGRRGFVQALPTRRTNFLDDEDLYECEPAAPQWVSDLDDSDELRVPAQTLTYEDEPEAAQPVNRPDELLFSAPTEPQSISSPVFQAQTPTDPFPHLDLLQALDTEINALLAFTFECMNDGRIHQLPALGSDLHWALSALASEYSGFALMERLDTAVEVLLQHIATSGSN